MRISEPQHETPALLSESIRFLRKKGAPDLAQQVQEFLDRVATQPAAAPDGYRAETLAAACRRLDGRRSVRAMLPRIAQEFGCDHCTLHRVSSPSVGALLRSVETTYPRRWLIRYTLMRYVTVDPVLAHSEAWQDLFYWDEIPDSDPGVAQFLSDARENGIGPSGITDVQYVPDGGAIAVSLSSQLEVSEFRAMFEPRILEYRRVAQALSLAFFRCNIVGRSAGMSKVEHAYLAHLLNGGERNTFDPGPKAEHAVIEKSIARKMNCSSFEQALLIIGKTGLLESPEFILHSLTEH